MRSWPIKNPVEVLPDLSINNLDDLANHYLINCIEIRVIRNSMCSVRSLIDDLERSLNIISKEILSGRQSIVENPRKNNSEFLRVFSEVRQKLGRFQSAKLPNFETVIFKIESLNENLLRAWLNAENVYPKLFKLFGYEPGRFPKKTLTKLNWLVVKKIQELKGLSGLDRLFKPFFAYSKTLRALFVSKSFPIVLSDRLSQYDLYSTRYPLALKNAMVEFIQKTKCSGKA